MPSAKRTRAGVAKDGKIGAENHEVNGFRAPTIQGVHAGTLNDGFNEFLWAQFRVVRVIGVRRVEDLEGMIVRYRIRSGKGWWVSIIRVVIEELFPVLQRYAFVFVFR